MCVAFDTGTKPGSRVNPIAYFHLGNGALVRNMMGVGMATPPLHVDTRQIAEPSGKRKQRGLSDLN